jgi:hypothetical protein
VFHKSLHTIHKLIILCFALKVNVFLLQIWPKSYSFAESFFKFRDLPGRQIKHDLI